MENNPLNKNALKKSYKACPMPPSMARDFPTTYSIPKRSWISDSGVFLYILISGIAGLILLSIAIFIPPTVFIEEISSGSGSSYSIQIVSIPSSPIPLIMSFSIGISAAIFIPLIDSHSFRHRLLGAVLFAVFYSNAYLIDMINMNMLFSIIAGMYGYTSPYEMLLWLTSPWLFLLMAVMVITSFCAISTTISLLTAYFSEFLWNSIRGPLYIDPKTRRTAVILRGHTKGTVLSVNHKVGYMRGFARASKWQSYGQDE